MVVKGAPVVVSLAADSLLSNLISLVPRSTQGSSRATIPQLELQNSVTCERQALPHDTKFCNCREEWFWVSSWIGLDQRRAWYDVSQSVLKKRPRWVNFLPRFFMIMINLNDIVCAKVVMYECMWWLNGEMKCRIYFYTYDIWLE